MDPRLTPLYDIFKLNSRLFLNCLEGMDEDQARWRPGAASNSAGFVAAHLVDSRRYSATVLGLSLPPCFGGRLDAAKSIGEVKDLPRLDEIRSEWKSVTGNLRERLKAATPEELDRPVATQFPVDDKRVLGVFGFLMQHDSYHIGQLAFLRKQAGLEAMRYS